MRHGMAIGCFGSMRSFFALCMESMSDEMENGGDGNEFA